MRLFGKQEPKHADLRYSQPIEGFPGGTVVKHLPDNTDVGRSLGCEDPLEKEMTTHCTILAWEIP